MKKTIISMIIIVLLGGFFGLETNNSNVDTNTNKNINVSNITLKKLRINYVWYNNKKGYFIDKIDNSSPIAITYEEVEVEYPADFEKGDIILVKQYINFAEEYQNEGFFIDSNGFCYAYNFSGTYGDVLDEQIYNNENFVANLSSIAAKSVPFKKIDEESLQIIKEKITSIDPNAQITSEHKAYDAGQHSWYAVLSNGNVVLLGSVGDYDKASQDSAARYIYSMLTQ